MRQKICCGSSCERRGTEFARWTTAARSNARPAGDPRQAQPFGFCQRSRILDGMSKSRPDSTCPECFASPWVREYIVEHSTVRGTCPSCRRRNQPLIRVFQLHDPFENLLSCYHSAEGPLEEGTAVIDLIQSIGRCFQSDWSKSTRLDGCWR